MDYDLLQVLIELEDLHDRHEEHRHVEHRGDAQSDLLPRLGRNEENKPKMWFFYYFYLCQKYDELWEEICIDI